MITYADVPLIMGDAAGLINSLINEVFVIRQMPTQPAPALVARAADLSPQVPTIAWPADPAPIQVNRLYVPTGASRWTTFYALVNATQLDAIMLKAYNSSANQATPQKLVMEWEDVWTGTGVAPPPAFVAAKNVGSTRVETTLYPLPPIPVSAMADNRKELTTETGPYEGPWRELYVLPLVDVRYFWQWTSAGALVTPSNGLKNWHEYLDQLYSVLGLSSENLNKGQGVEDVYGSPSPLLNRPYGNAAALLDVALWSVGRRLVPGMTTTDKKFNVVRAGYYAVGDSKFGPSTSTAAYSGFETWLRTHLPIAGWRQGFGDGSLPSALKVSFARDQSTTKYWTENVALSEILPGVQGAKDVAAEIRSTMTAYPAEEQTPTNRAALQALAKQIATDFFCGAVFRFDFVVTGVSAYTGDHSDAVEIKFGTDQENDWVAQTRAWSLPMSFYAQQVQYSAPMQNSSSPSSKCPVPAFNGVYARDMTGYRKGVWQAVWKNPDDCFVLVDYYTCSSSPGLGG